MRKIYDFKGLNKNQKWGLYKEYFRKEWRNLVPSFFFILLSSSSDYLSKTNGAIYVMIWFTVSMILAIIIFESQSNYMKCKENAEKYAKKHPNAEVEKGLKFNPETDGLISITAQFLAASILMIVIIPLAVVLQSLDLKTYLEVHSSFFVGLYEDTYMISVFYGIRDFTIYILNDRTNGRMPVNYILPLSIKRVCGFVGGFFLIGNAIWYYYTMEFAGLFGPIWSKPIGAVYIIFMLRPLFKCIMQIIEKKSKELKTV